VGGGKPLPYLSLWPLSCAFCVLNGAFWTVAWRIATSEPEPQDFCSPNPYAPKPLRPQRSAVGTPGHLNPKPPRIGRKERPGASTRSGATYFAHDLLVVMVVDDGEAEPPKGIEAPEDGMGHSGDRADELPIRGLKLDEPLAYSHQLVVNFLTRDFLRHHPFRCLASSSGYVAGP